MTKYFLLCVKKHKMLGFNSSSNIWKQSQNSFLKVIERENLTFFFTNECYTLLDGPRQMGAYWRHEQGGGNIMFKVGL